MVNEGGTVISQTVINNMFSKTRILLTHLGKDTVYWGMDDMREYLEQFDLRQALLMAEQGDHAALEDYLYDVVVVHKTERDAREEAWVIINRIQHGADPRAELYRFAAGNGFLKQPRTIYAKDARAGMVVEVGGVYCCLSDVRERGNYVDFYGTREYAGGGETGTRLVRTAHRYSDVRVHYWEDEA